MLTELPAMTRVWMSRETMSFCMVASIWPLMTIFAMLAMIALVVLSGRLVALPGAGGNSGSDAGILPLARNCDGADLDIATVRSAVSVYAGAGLVVTAEDDRAVDGADGEILSGRRARVSLAGNDDILAPAQITVYGEVFQDARAHRAEVGIARLGTIARVDAAIDDDGFGRS